MQNIDFDLFLDRDLARESKRFEATATCAFCGDEAHDDDDHRIEHLTVCSSCLDSKARWCECCGGHRHEELSDDARCDFETAEECDAHFDAIENEEAGR